MSPYADLGAEVRAFSAMRECLGPLVEVRRELSGVGWGLPVIIPASRRAYMPSGLRQRNTHVLPEENIYVFPGAGNMK